MGEATRKWEQIFGGYSDQGVRTALDSDESAAAPLAESPSIVVITTLHHCITLVFSAIAGHSRSDAGAVSPRWRCNPLLQANGAKFSGGAGR